MHRIKNIPYEKGMKSVREFTVKVKAFTKEEALNKADIQAKTLTDLLAVKSAKHLGHILTGFNRDPDPGRAVRQDSE